MPISMCIFREDPRLILGWSSRIRPKYRDRTAISALGAGLKLILGQGPALNAEIAL